MTVVTSLTVSVGIKTALDHTALFGMKVSPVACSTPCSGINILPAEFFATFPAP
jgi:hypothetical protein